MHNIVTASEALADGTSYAALMSVAKFQDLQGNPGAAQKLRLVAREVASATGFDLRRPNRRRPHNDNRRRRVVA